MGRRSWFTAGHKRDAVLVALTKKKTISEVCRELQVSETRFNGWRGQALEAIDEAMKDNAEDLSPALAQAWSTSSAAPMPSISDHRLCIGNFRVS